MLNRQQIASRKYVINFISKKKHIFEQLLVIKF